MPGHTYAEGEGLLLDIVVVDMFGAKLLDDAEELGFGIVAAYSSRTLEEIDCYDVPQF